MDISDREKERIRQTAARQAQELQEEVRCLERRQGEIQGEIQKINQEVRSLEEKRAELMRNKSFLERERKEVPSILAAKKRELDKYEHDATELIQKR